MSTRVTLVENVDIQEELTNYVYAFDATSSVELSLSGPNLAYKMRTIANMPGLVKTLFCTHLETCDIDTLKMFFRTFSDVLTSVYIAESDLTTEFLYTILSECRKLKSFGVKLDGPFPNSFVFTRELLNNITYFEFTGITAEKILEGGNCFDNITHFCTNSATDDIIQILPQAMPNLQSLDVRGSHQLTVASIFFIQDIYIQYENSGWEV